MKSKIGTLLLTVVVCTASLAGMLLKLEANAQVLADASAAPAAPVELELAGGATGASIACCDNLEFPSSCSLVEQPSDLTTCDPAAEVAKCKVVDGNPTICEPAKLLCCDETSQWAGVVWANICLPHGPGDVCSGIVIGY